MLRKLNIPSGTTFLFLCCIAFTWPFAAAGQGVDEKISKNVTSESAQEALIGVSTNSTYPFSFLFYQSTINDQPVVLVKLRSEKTKVVHDFFTVVGTNLKFNFDSLWAADGEHFVYFRSIYGGLGFYRTQDLAASLEKKNFSAAEFFKKAKLIDRINILSDKKNPQHHLLPIEWTDSRSLIFAVSRRANHLTQAGLANAALGRYRYDFATQRLYRLKPGEAQNEQFQVVLNRLVGENKTKQFSSHEIVDETRN